jgi:hypothetical protein
MMNFGRYLTVPMALLTSLVLSVFLFSLSGNTSFIDSAQTSPGEAKIRGAPSPQADSMPVLELMVDLTSFFLSDRDHAKKTGQLSNESPEVPGKDDSSEVSDGDEQCSVSLRYPNRITRWCGVISQNAVKRQIDPDLIAALIWQESGGNPDAYSRDGAVGLMQVMPRDGIAARFKCPNGPCFGNRPSMNQLEDPNFNVSYGTKMLAGLINRRGSLREALKSYGPAGAGYSYADKVLSIYHQYKE